MIEIMLPWPAKELQPNARTHYHAKAKAARKYRQTAWALTMAAIAKPADWHRYTLHMVFCPPDGRRRDMDNALAACKSAIDGIADAMGVDDRGFRYVLDWGAEGDGRPNGFVRVTVTQS